MTAAVLTSFLLGFGIFAFLKDPRFGRRPKGERLRKIRASPNFREGQFQNLSPTPSLTEGANFGTLLKTFLLNREKNRFPQKTIPSQKTDLHKLSPEENILVWFGHSSYFLQLENKKILVDPVFSGSASPLPGGTRAFRGTDRYTVADMPEIDYLFITHDHWDHLDHKTISHLRPCIRKVICGLGTGEHLESWGYDPDIIFEKDWNEELVLEDGFRVHATPARHFSGRGFKRNQVLWTSFVLLSPGFRIFLGGDSGYDTHFSEIGEQFGPFDLAILENGQYNRYWKYIHARPHEVLKAAKELRAKKMLPVHNSKFSLANHSWDEPLRTISALHRDETFQLITPMIGEKVVLDDPGQKFSRWWES